MEDVPVALALALPCHLALLSAFVNTVFGKLCGGRFFFAEGLGKLGYPVHFCTHVGGHCYFIRFIGWATPVLF